MSYARAVRFEGGETLIACSICGFPYLFPSELTYCDDKLFRCQRTCMEETRQSNLQQQVASQRRKDQIVSPLSGPTPTWRREAPTPPGSPVLWYDAADINLLGNVGISDQDPIGTWKNKGSLGASGDLAQATASAKPKYKLFATVARVNSSPSVYFDGNDTLDTGTVGTLSQPTVIALVFRQTSGVNVFCDGNDGTNRNAVFRGVGGVVNLYAGAATAGSTQVTNATYNSVVATFNGASSSIVFNDADDHAVGTCGAAALDGFRLGAGGDGLSPMTGELLNVLVWNGTLPAAVEVATYFDARYGTGWPL